MLFAKFRLELFVVVFGFDEVVLEAVEGGEAYCAENYGDNADEGALLLESEGERKDVDN